MNEAEGERTLLVCWPDGWAGYIVPGSVKDVCHLCKRAVWRAPSSFLIGQVDDCICAPCMFASAQPGTKVEPLEPPQVAEYDEWRHSEG